MPPVTETEPELPEITEESVKSLSLEVSFRFILVNLKTRKEYALLFKNAGNKTYSARKFSAAIDLYTKALLCHADPVFYSNRAACTVPRLLSNNQASQH